MCTISPHISSCWHALLDFSRSLPVLLAWASQIPHKTQVSFAGLFSYLLASFGLFGACSQRYLYQRVRYSDRHGYSNRHRSIDAGLFCRTLVSFADLCWYTLVSFDLFGAYSQRCVYQRVRYPPQHRSLLQVSFAEHWSLLQISECISELDTRHNTGLFCRSLVIYVWLFWRIWRRLPALLISASHPARVMDLETQVSFAGLFQYM